MTGPAYSYKKRGKSYADYVAESDMTEEEKYSALVQHRGGFHIQYSPSRGTKES